MPNSTLPDEQELLQRIARGEEAAFTLVFNHYSKQVFDVAMLYLKDAVVSRETVQEVFMKVWLKRADMAEVTNFSDYLFILTRNYIYDSFKKQLSRQKAHAYLYRQAPVNVSNDTDHRLQEHQYRDLLHNAISSLPPGRRKVYLARNQGLSNEEISHQLNISVHTVKKQMQLAMQFVRSFVKQRLQGWLL